MENQKLPNSTLILVLGIISIICSCCCSIIGSIIGLIGLLVANSSIKTYNENPEMYIDYNTVKTGRILNIVGIVLGIISIGWAIYSIQAMGGWDAYMEEIQNAIEQAQGAR